MLTISMDVLLLIMIWWIQFQILGGRSVSLNTFKQDFQVLIRPHPVPFLNHYWTIKIMHLIIIQKIFFLSAEQCTWLGRIIKISAERCTRLRENWSRRHHWGWGHELVWWFIRIANTSGVPPLGREISSILRNALVRWPSDSWPRTSKVGILWPGLSDFRSLSFTYLWWGIKVDSR